MDLLLIAVAFCTFIYLIFIVIEFAYGFNKIKLLTEQVPLTHERLPMVSIIFSALDEEVAIEETVSSFLKLDYPNFEVIAVNDRSTDSTPDILNRLSQLHPTLVVHHINNLPAGWFGKNHALHVAAKAARGEWLLFTDADVLMKKETLVQAMSYAIDNTLDHLTIFEHHIRKTFGLKLLLLSYYLCYSIQRKPWRISQSWSKHTVGHGAFNLVRKSAYQHCGGHQTIALECLDDMKLGELIKSRGFRQDTVDGKDFVEREWYGSLNEMISGVEKNSFAYFNYRMLPSIRDTVLAIIFFIWPLFSLFFCTGLIVFLNSINILLMLGISAFIAKKFRLKKRYALFYPLSIAILLYSIWNSIAKIYKNKGVIWRGTHYSLKLLRKTKNTT
jgi:glycosyltransferase involved in cell wall biosynthesis